MKKKVYLICTGGTIGMHEIKIHTQENTDKFGEKIQKILSSLENAPLIKLNIYTPQIDSSEMTVDNWNKIAEDIYENYDSYDGFVILHGTDTMAYTGSALSYMLENLNKPVILTGAQTPLSNDVTDARENLINATYIAGNYQIPEVCIYFNQSLFRANRTTKFSTLNYDAYLSPNYPVLAKIGSTIKLSRENILNPSQTDNLVLTKFEQFDIRIIYFTPSLQPEAFAKQIDGAKAVILATYGDGNFRMSDNRFLDIIINANKNGVIVVNKSQCLNSRTSPSYDSGDSLSKAGIVSAVDQTMESITAKLLYFFTKKLSKQKIENLIQQNIRGELTSTSFKQMPSPIIRRYSFLSSDHLIQSNENESKFGL